MSDAARSEHLSIGEVLALVQEDFPDVTISKIRFLESQGLIAPERTGAGFRKFYDSDIERLRWILRQQGDHFLPLKVIKKMLEDGADPSAGVQTQPTLWSSTEADREEGGTGESGGSGGSTGTGSASTEDPGGRGERFHSPAHPTVVSSPKGRRPADSDSPATPTRASADAGRSGSAPDNSGPGGESPRDDPPAGDSGGGSKPESRPAQTSGGHRTLSTPADVVAALQEDPRPAKRRRSERIQDEHSGAADRGAGSASEPEDSMNTTAGEDASQVRTPVTRSELCELCGVPGELIDALEQFGFISPTSLGGAHVYDEGAIAITRMAARYAELGIEPRHLRMYKIAAEREAGMIEQLVVPLLKQRNPTARQNAAERSRELATMGADLHAMFLSHQLRRILGG